MDKNNFSGLIFNAKSTIPKSDPEYDENYSDGSGSHHRSPTFTRFKKRPLSPEKYAELEKMYSTVVVHDFGDEYHMSEEERKKKFQFYDAFSKVTKCKRKYRKLDEFVRVFRYCLECLDVVAQNNGVYDPEKFKKLVLRGDIDVFGLHFPKYIGKDKKQINWSYISEFVLDKERDYKELSKEQKSEISEMSTEEAYEQLFTEEEKRIIAEAVEHMDDDEIDMPYDEDDPNDKRTNIVVVSDKEDTKALTKMAPVILDYVKEEIRSQKRRSDMEYRMHSFVWENQQDDMDRIAAMDEERGWESDDDFPIFTGDISKRKDFMKYLMALENYELEECKVNYRGKMRTESQVREIELKDALEKDGWNIRNLYGNKKNDKKLKKARKKEKQLEKELKEKLIKLNERKVKRGEAPIEFDAKGGGKKKKKKGKKKDKVSKEVKRYKEDAIDTMDGIMLDSIGRQEYDDYKTYKEDMESFSFADVFGK